MIKIGFRRYFIRYILQSTVHGSGWREQDYPFCTTVAWGWNAIGANGGEKNRINWGGLLKLILTNWQTPDIHIIPGEKKVTSGDPKYFNTRRPPYIRHITYYYNVRVAIDVIACTCSCPAITKSPDGPAGIFFLSFRWYSRLLRRRYGDFNDLNKQTANASSTTPSCINDTNY